jgi:hypothetical protein
MPSRLVEKVNNLAKTLHDDKRFTESETATKAASRIEKLETTLARQKARNAPKDVGSVGSRRKQP